MIRTLINLLFNIRLNGVQNTNIFIDHFEYQKNFANTTLKYEFCKTCLLHTKFMVHMYHVNCKPRSIIVQALRLSVVTHQVIL